MNDSFTIFMIAFESIVGLYLLICGIRGKGKAFDLTYVKDGCEEEYVRVARIWYAVLGGLAIIMAVADGLVNLAKIEALRVPFLAALVLILVAITVGYLRIRKYIDKNKQNV